MQGKVVSHPTRGSAPAARQGFRGTQVLLEGDISASTALTASFTRGSCPVPHFLVSFRKQPPRISSKVYDQMAPKSILITGCSSRGIGAALALALARRSHHIFATAQNPTRIPEEISSLSNVTVLPAGADDTGFCGLVDWEAWARCKCEHLWRRVNMAWVCRSSTAPQTL